MTFIIPGTPVAKGRPRMGRFGTYTPEKTVAYESLVQLAYMQRCENKRLEGPLRAEVRLYFPIPKSETKGNARKMSSGEIRPAKRPDLDNCLKAIFDALNGIAYDDDSQIVSVTCEKYYGKEPRAVVGVEEMAI